MGVVETLTIVAQHLLKNTQAANKRHLGKEADRGKAPDVWPNMSNPSATIRNQEFHTGIISLRIYVYNVYHIIIIILFKEQQMYKVIEQKGLAESCTVDVSAELCLGIFCHKIIRC